MQVNQGKKPIFYCKEPMPMNKNIFLRLKYTKIITI